MEKPTALIWIYIFSLLFIGISLLLLITGSPIYLLAMAMGNIQTILGGLFIILFIMITMIMQVIAWIKVAKNSRNAYTFFKISWGFLSVSLLSMLWTMVLLSDLVIFSFIVFSILMILTYQLFFSKKIILFFIYNQKNNDDKEYPIIIQK